MKAFATMLALASLFSVPASADTLGGIAGTLTDVKTGQPVAHATIVYYRAPYVENATIFKKVVTNGHGFFSDITLEPGRYILMTNVPGKVMGCAVDDVMGGETAHVKIEVGHDNILCLGPRIHPALIDPNATADVYRI